MGSFVFQILTICLHFLLLLLLLLRLENTMSRNDVVLPLSAEKPRTEFSNLVEMFSLVPVKC